MWGLEPSPRDPWRTTIAKRYRGCCAPRDASRREWGGSPKMVGGDPRRKTVLGRIKGGSIFIYKYVGGLFDPWLWVSFTGRPTGEQTFSVSSVSISSVDPGVKDPYSRSSTPSDSWPSSHLRLKGKLLSESKLVCEKTEGRLRRDVHIHKSKKLKRSNRKKQKQTKNVVLFPRVLCLLMELNLPDLI